MNIEKSIGPVAVDPPVGDRPNSGESDAIAESKPVVAWVAVAFIVGVAVAALAGAVIGFGFNAENLRESDALLKRARVLLQPSSPLPRRPRDVLRGRRHRRSRRDVAAVGRGVAGGRGEALPGSGGGGAGRAVGRAPGARGRAREGEGSAAVWPTGADEGRRDGQAEIDRARSPPGRRTRAPWRASKERVPDFQHATGVFLKRLLKCW